MTIGKISPAAIWEQVRSAANKVDKKLILNALSKNKAPIFICIVVLVIAYLANRELNKRNIAYQKLPSMLVSKIVRAASAILNSSGPETIKKSGPETIKKMTTFPINNMQVIIEQGDIIESSCEAIVNAANEQLSGGGGVCGAIFQAAGSQQLQSACDAFPSTNSVRCPVGDSRITDSFNLKSKGINCIIHTPGPDCRVIQDKNEQDRLLANAYRNSLSLAKKNKVKSIAFPFISSSIYAFPKERAAQIALSTVAHVLRSKDTKTLDVHFVLFSQDDFNLFCQKAKAEL